MVSRGSTASAFLAVHSAMVQASVTFRAAEIDRESADICQDGIGAARHPGNHGRGNPRRSRDREAATEIERSQEKGGRVYVIAAEGLLRHSATERHGTPGEGGEQSLPLVNVHERRNREISGPAASNAHTACQATLRRALLGLPSRRADNRPTS